MSFPVSGKNREFLLEMGEIGIGLLIGRPQGLLGRGKVSLKFMSKKE